MKKTVSLFGIVLLGCILATTWCFAEDPEIKTGEKPSTLLYVRTIPPGAKVTLDGKELGTSDGVFPVEPCVGTVVVELDGKTDKKQITIHADQVTRVELTLNATEEVDSDSDVVIEGVGWKDFRVGVSEEELIKAVGKPDQIQDINPTSKIFAWNTKYHLTYLFSSQNGHCEIHFLPGFKSPLASGIKIGSSENKVLETYGVPDHMVNNGTAKMLEYDKRGVLMWVDKGKVLDFTVFPPIKPNNTNQTTDTTADFSTNSNSNQDTSNSDDEEAVPLRTWNDASGSFSVEAQFVELKDDKVTLKKINGKMIQVPLAQLSEADRDFAKKEAAAEAEATALPVADSRELSLDNGKMANKLSIGGGGYGVRFKVDGNSHYVTSVRLHGSRYGHTQPPKENFKVWICDNQFQPIATFEFPYSSYKRGEPTWKTFKIKPTRVPEEFIVCFGFNAEQTKGVYVSYDDQPSTASITGVPGSGETFEPFTKGNWLIRCKVEKRTENGQAAISTKQNVLADVASALEEKNNNLLQNPSVEEGGDSPNAWEQGAQLDGVKYSWDKNVGSDGHASLAIEKTANNYFPIAQWSQTVERAGKMRNVQFSAQVKAERMNKAILDVIFLDKDDQWISHQWAGYIGTKKEGDPPADHDWRKYSGSVPIPPKTAKIKFALQVYGPGRVWFDAIDAHYVP